MVETEIVDTAGACSTDCVMVAWDCVFFAIKLSSEWNIDFYMSVQKLSTLIFSSIRTIVAPSKISLSYSIC